MLFHSVAFNGSYLHIAVAKKNTLGGKQAFATGSFVVNHISVRSHSGGTYPPDRSTVRQGRFARFADKPSSHERQLRGLPCGTGKPIRLEDEPGLLKGSFEVSNGSPNCKLPI